MHPVYEPREDSFLLADVVKDKATGRVLDMGTGTGIQAITAAKNDGVTEVIGLDVNPDAIKYARQNNFHPKISYFHSDLFSHAQGKFDTILFNAPYLPDDEEIADVAVDGGPTGLEMVSEFMYQAKDYLTANGIILIVVSSHTDLSFLEKLAKRIGFHVETAAHRKLDFETLYVYELKHAE